MKKEKDPASKDRLAKIDRDMAHLQEDRTRLRLQWEAEKESIRKIRNAKEEIERARIEADKAEREGNLGRAAELRYGRLIDLGKQLEAENRRLQDLQSRQKMLKEEVDEEDVAEIVSKWTGIPLNRMLEG